MTIPKIKYLPEATVFSKDAAPQHWDAEARY